QEPRASNGSHVDANEVHVFSVRGDLWVILVDAGVFASTDALRNEGLRFLFGQELPGRLDHMGKVVGFPVGRQKAILAGSLTPVQHVHVAFGFTPVDQRTRASARTTAKGP